MTVTIVLKELSKFNTEYRKISVNSPKMSSISEQVYSFNSEHIIEVPENIIKYCVSKESTELLFHNRKWNQINMLDLPLIGCIEEITEDVPNNSWFTNISLYIHSVASFCGK